MTAAKIVIAVGIAFVAAAGATTAERFEVPLRWSLNVHGDHPTSLPPITTGSGLLALKVEKLVDKRDKDREVGESTESRERAVTVYTDSNVPGFVRDALVSQLELAGIDVVPDQPDRILKMDLIEFWATEGDSYRARVRVRARLTDAQGKEIWSGLVRGVGENWGRSLNVDNFNETFSNAVFDLVVSLLKEDGFTRGLRKRG